ncbi:hypothetical protein F4677DRAFT_389028 [Hypoxylon crocopeplum]|nr:hypothetical protein F4677DRAFT_389028 [Hypoxylon crocopeplum]
MSQSSSMTIQEVEVIKKELIDNCLSSWASRGKDINGTGASVTGLPVTQLWQFDKDQLATSGAAWQLDGPGTGWHFIPFNDGIPKHPHIIQLRKRLDYVKQDKVLSERIEDLLNKEIDQLDLIAFYLSESVTDETSASKSGLELYEKVKLIAKFRLLQYVTASQPPPPPPPNTEGKVKMFMLRVTPYERLKIEIFLAPISLEYCWDCFRDLLEDVAEPYLSAGISNRDLLERDLFGRPEGWVVHPLTDEEQGRWDEQLRLEASLSREELSSWSYRLCDLPVGNADHPTTFYERHQWSETKWVFIDTKEAYEKMFRYVKERGMSAIFIRTWKIAEAVQISERRNEEASRSQQGTLPRQDPPQGDGPPQGSQTQEGSSAQLESSMPQGGDEKEERGSQFSTESGKALEAALNEFLSQI